MINRADFKKMKEIIETYDSKREELIKISRDITKKSKQAIYSLQRKNIKEAKELIADAKKNISVLKKQIIHEPELLYEGSYNAALQEYAEGVTFLYFLEKNKLISSKELDVGTENYLLGLCDLTGELVRYAVNRSINDDFAKVIEIKEFVSQIYEIMMEFNFRNSELRKKYDSIKWNLQKLEDLVYELKLKGKL